MFERHKFHQSGRDVKPIASRKASTGSLLVQVGWHVSGVGNRHHESGLRGEGYGGIKTREACDLIVVFDAIQGSARPASVLAGIAGGLKDDGVFLTKDIGASSKCRENLNHPIDTFRCTILVMHGVTASLTLDRSGVGMMWGEGAVSQMLAGAVLSSLEERRLPHDLQDACYVARK